MIGHGINAVGLNNDGIGARVAYDQSDDPDYKRIETNRTATVDGVDVLSLIEMQKKGFPLTPEERMLVEKYYQKTKGAVGPYATPGLAPSSPAY